MDARKVGKVRQRCTHCEDRSFVCCPRCCGKGYFNWQIAVISWVSLDRCCLCHGKGVVPCPHCSAEKVPLKALG